MSVQRSGSKKRAKRPKTSEFDFDAAKILPEGCPASTLDQVIDFAYTGVLPLYPDNSFIYFFAVVVELRFKEAVKIYKKYLKELYKHEHRLVSPGMTASLLSYSQNSAEEWECSEYVKDINDETNKYLLKEPLDKLKDDEKFLKKIGRDGLLSFLSRDDLAKPEEEMKVTCTSLTQLE